MGQIGGWKLLGRHLQYVKADAFQHRANFERPIQGQLNNQRRKGDAPYMDSARGREQQFRGRILALRFRQV